MTEIPENASIRATLLAEYETRLKKLFPDGAPSASPLSFDALEAAAVRSGDETARALMSQSLAQTFSLPTCTKQGRCKCGRNLQWSDKPRTIETVRGSVHVTRLHGYCRVCERGFFPLRPDAAAARAPAKRKAAASPQRDGQ